MNHRMRSLTILASWLLLTITAHARTVTYVYTDPQGTPLAEADANGNITARFDYTPYGQPVATIGAAPDGPGYTGHVNDPDTGFVYMQARYYSPDVARFASVDPVGPVPGDVFGFNRYGYANDNPIVNTDPDGRQSCPQCLYYPESMAGSYQHQVEINQGASRKALEGTVGLTPVVGDAQSVVEAANNPTPFNIAIAVVGLVPEVGPQIADVAKVARGAKAITEGAAGGDRAGKAFTRAGKKEVKEANAVAHGGETACSNCGRTTVPAEQSRAGVTPPGNETHVDHIIPKSKNGNGSPDNGQVLCRDCNLQKSDKY